MAAHNLRIARVAHEVGYGGGDFRDVAILGQLPDRVVDYIGYASRPGAETGFAGSHGFEEHQAESLLAAGQREHVARGVFGPEGRVVDDAGEMHPAGDAQLRGERLP